jgi:hypothetical protein
MIFTEDPNSVLNAAPRSGVKITVRIQRHKAVILGGIPSLLEEGI